MMISKEESPRCHVIVDNTIYMHYKDIVNSNHKEEFTSDKVCVSKEELKEMLKSKNYFKP